MKQFMFSLVCLLCSHHSNSQDQEIYSTSEVIVRLNFKLLNWDLIDDSEIKTTTILKLLNSEGEKYLATLPEKQFDFRYLNATKIFPYLFTWDSISIGRQGQTVFVPPFWATFRIDVPNNTDVPRFCSDLDDLYPFVIYAHPNYSVETTSVPNDPEFVDQLSLNSSNAIDHIMIDSAWNIETGVPWIKVGVFDTGIDSTHEDIELLTGWNYYDQYQFSWGNCDPNDHGMKVAGIIGAKRNNGIGVAGIAGGDAMDTTGHTGVSLIDFKRISNVGTVNSIDVVSASIIDAARAPGTYYNWMNLTGGNQVYDQNAPGYGIHIGNHSYAYRISDGNKQEDDTIVGGGATGPGFYETCDLCRESFLFSLQNGVVNVVSRGNKLLGTTANPLNYIGDTLYPAGYDDSWVISVSSSAADGNRLIGGVNGTDSYFPPVGFDIDLLAPGSRDIIRTTHSLQNSNSTSLYGNFSGTSSAAPHVSGVAALLLSYYNKNCYSNVNLDPADVEYILQKSATPTLDNITSGGYDIASGHGRLNAFEALKMIELPKYQIVHPDTLAFDLQLLDQDTISIHLASPLSTGVTGPLGNQFPLIQNVDYKVVKYKYQLKYNFGQYMQPTTTLLDAWVRHSQTNSLGSYSDTITVVDSTGTGPIGNQVITYVTHIDTFGVEPMCSIDSITNDSIITLSGYYYHFIGRYNPTIGTFLFNENFWYPINPITQQPKMTFSIYIRDAFLSSQYDFPCYADNFLIDSFANLNETIDPPSFEIYPNPGIDQLTIRMSENAKKGRIQLLDVSGRIVNEIDIRKETLYFVDTSVLGNGVYFVTYITQDGKFSKKWIKQ